MASIADGIKQLTVEAYKHKKSDSSEGNLDAESMRLAWRCRFYNHFYPVRICIQAMRLKDRGKDSTFAS